MENKLKKKSFFESAVLLSEMCDLIENSEEFTDLLEKEFNQTNQSLEESIDRRKYVYAEADSKIKLAKEYKRKLDEKIKTLEKVKERVTESTRSVIEQNPNLPFKDTLGNKLSIVNNSMASLEYSRPYFVRSKSVSNIIDTDDLTREIDPYIKDFHFLTIDTEKLKKDLESGKTFSWVKIVRGTHLRGLKI